MEYTIYIQASSDTILDYLLTLQLEIVQVLVGLGLALTNYLHKQNLYLTYSASP